MFEMVNNSFLDHLEKWENSGNIENAHFDHKKSIEKRDEKRGRRKGDAFIFGEKGTYLFLSKRAACGLAVSF